jgi:hypothetical protein
VLAETLVALGLLMVCLLGGLAVHVASRRVIDRVEAQGAALRALESTLEALRAGALPLASGPVERGAADGIAIDLQVTPSDEVPALVAVRLEARYVVAGEEHRQALSSMFWTPS